MPPELIELGDPGTGFDTPAMSIEVGLEVVIGEDGLVSDAKVIRGAGDPWDAAALQALLGALFNPAWVDGAPRAVRIEFVYVFEASTRRAAMAEQSFDRRPRESGPGRELRGQLLEKGTRAPVDGALILVGRPGETNPRQIVTDEQGQFEVEGLEPGTWEVEVVGGDFAELQQRLDVPAAAPGEPLDLGPVYIKRQSRNRFQTVVRGERERTAATEVVLRDVELRRVPGTFGDPTRVVATLPGVARSPFGLGFFVVRGASFENTGFFIDGHPALFLYHLLGGPAVIHPQLVGELRFYPGGYPAEYGRLAGGVIAIQTADPPVDRWHLDVEVDVLKASAFFSVPFDEGRGVVSVAARRSYFELLVPLVVDGVSLSYTDYQLRATWAPRPDVRLRFLAIGAEDRFSAESQGDEETASKQDIALGFHRLNAAVDWDIARDLTWWNSVAWEHDRTKGQRVSADDDTLTVDFAGWFLNWRSGLKVKAGEALSFEAGLDALYTRLGANLDIPSLPPLGDPRPPTFDPIAIPVSVRAPYVSLAPWISTRFEPTPGLALIPAVRFNFDHYASDWRFTVDPKVTVRWTVHPQWVLKATGALAHQPPQPFQVESPFGDPTIPPVRALQTSAGVEWRPDERFELSLEGFYNLLDNVARPQSLLTAEDGELRRTSWASDVRGRAFGLEVLLRKQLGDWWYGWVSYTLIRAERQFPPNDFALAAFDQTHILNAALGFELGDGWSVGARFTLTSGTPYYPIIGSRYDADRDRFQPLFAGSQSRLPPFHRLDLRVDKEWLFNTWILGFYIDVQNVYNAANPETQRYSYDFSLRTDGPGVPILPTLGVKARF